jgi:Protein of unknown function (DUF3638)
LQRMHYFWATEDRSTILLREKKFTSRVNKYAITLDNNRQCDGDIECRIFSIPPHHDKDTHWIVSTTGSDVDSKDLDKLVVMPAESRILRVLGKFDDRRFIHTFVDSSGAVRVDFPRYQLSLEHRGGALQVREFKGFDLSLSQILKGTLHGFSMYLLLTERSKCQGRTLLLFPEGTIQRQSTGETRICTKSTAFDASLHYHCLRVHPRYGTLYGMNMVATLQMAALHASTSMETNDSCFDMKGSERALELVRQCFSSSPLTPEEEHALQNVKAVCGGRFPAVRIACDHLFISSEQVSFLYKDMSAGEFEPSLKRPVVSEEDVSKYLLDVRSCRYSPRSTLTNEEMALCFGGCQGPAFAIPVESPSSMSSCSLIVAAAGRHASSQLHELEGALASLVSNHQTNSDADAFPLSCPSQTNPLFQSIHQELRDSWSSYQATRSEIFLPASSARDHFPRILSATSTELDFLESHLVSAFDANQPISSSADRSILIKFMKLSGILPAVSKSDFTRALYHPSWITALNPSLTNATHGQMREALDIWHRLCVLEDKLVRLCSLSTSSEIASELRVRRCFDAQKFPSWLAFEVEHQIQIRPEQALIAQHLIESPGDIMQLNMGLGKTRVIVPMLLLFWTLDSKETPYARITRLNVLPNLIHEASDFFRSTLTGSIARIRLFALPFCRDVVLDDQRLASMTALLNQCRESLGFFLVCPEHRLSLELKTVELHRAGRIKTAETFVAQVHDTSMWRELLDESDELLHHRFRLIYATGAVDKLPQAVHRYRMPQFLLFKFLACPKLLEWVDRYSDVVIRDGKTSCDAFPSILCVELVLTEGVGHSGVGVTQNVEQRDCACRNGSMHMFADVGVAVVVYPVAVRWRDAFVLGVVHTRETSVARSWRTSIVRLPSVVLP